MAEAPVTTETSITRQSKAADIKEDCCPNDQSGRKSDEPLRVDGKPPRVADAKGDDGKTSHKAHPTDNRSYRQHVAHLSFSWTGMCGLFSTVGGLETAAPFFTIYAVLFLISYHLEIKAAHGMRRDEPGLQEFRLARLPLAIGGLGFCVNGIQSGGETSVASVLLFVFCAFSCGMADAHAWAMHKTGGGR